MNPTNCDKSSVRPNPAMTSSSSLSRNMLASALGSCTTVVVLNPISVVKIRLQNQNLQARTGIVPVIQAVHHAHGIRGFWLGTQSGLVQAMPGTILYMAVYEQMKKATEESIYAPAISGGIARTIAVTATAPFELARTIQASSQSPASKKGFIALLGSIVSESGVIGLFRGYRSTVFRDVPYSSIYWLVFENLKSRSTDKGLSVNVVNFLAGAAGGIVAALVTHPFDVLKTRQQLASPTFTDFHTTRIPCASTLSVAPPSEVQFPRITLLSMYHEGGLGSWYRGLQLRLATVVPGGAIMITVYEFVKRFGNYSVN